MAEQSRSDEELVGYEERGEVAVISLNRPDVHNAQNGALLYALDDAFDRFAQDDRMKVAILRGNGKSFSAGHDIGPRSDRDRPFDRRSLWWDHSVARGVERRLAREEELYIGLCRRWRALPKPTIAMVHGACVAGGLMLAWCCDLVYAAETAFFADPVVSVGLPGMEYFVHPWVMGGRQAKEFLFTGRRVLAPEALQLGMVNGVFGDDQLEASTVAVAERICRMPRLGLTLAKMAVNRAEDAMGLQVGMDSAFGLHQLGHAHNAETTSDPNGGLAPQSIKRFLENGDDRAETRGAGR